MVNNQYIKIDKSKLNKFINKTAFKYKKQISEVVMDVINWDKYLKDSKD